MMISKSLLSLFILSWSTSLVSGYASWLQCFIDLDETEVVMNHPIKSAEEAPYYVEIEARVNEDTEWKTANVEYPSNQLSTVEIRLRVPDELKSQNVQYVVESSDGGTFNKAPTKCDGTRSHGNNHDEIVYLQLDGTTNSVELTAGWATGHAPVNLTPKLMLLRQPQTEL